MKIYFSLDEIIFLYIKFIIIIYLFIYIYFGCLCVEYNTFIIIKLKYIHC